MNNSLDEYHAARRSPAIVKHDGNDKEIGRVFTEYNDKLVIIDGENKKEHVYLIPKTKVDHYGDNQVYFDIPENVLNEFEV